METVRFLLNNYKPFNNRKTSYQPLYDLECNDIERLRAAVAKEGDDIYKHLPGHPCITGSSVVVNMEFTHTLLLYHHIHEFHKQMGGHTEECDKDLPECSVRELCEESEIHAAPLFRRPIDLITWRMIESKQGPEHDVHDVAFLFVVPGDIKFNANPSGGKKEIMWMPLPEFRDAEYIDRNKPTFKNNPQNIEYNQRIYEKIMWFKKKYYH